MEFTCVKVTRVPLCQYGNDGHVGPIQGARRRHIENARATSDPQLREMFLKLAEHFTWLAARRPLADKPDRVRALMRHALDAAKTGAQE
jgi:hypothetical protein